MSLRSLAGSLLTSALLLVPGASIADWVPAGVPMCQGCTGFQPLTCSDKAGGAFVAWRDQRNEDDVYLQRVAASGTIPPGWPTDGIPVCALARFQTPVSLVNDGSGGALVAWLDYRAPSQDVYVQRILADGSIAPGWQTNGVAVSQALGDQNPVSMISDGSGGAFLVWEDYRDSAISDRDIYAQHITADGTFAPGWPANGLPVCVESHAQARPSVVGDGSGGIFVTWVDTRGGLAAFAQHLLGDGSVAPNWTANGVAMSPGRVMFQALADGTGGFYLMTGTLHPTFGFSNLYVQRFTFDGMTVPGWPEPGFLVCGASGYRSGTFAASDAFGGVLLTWYDYRFPTYDAVFAERVLPSGVRAPGWVMDGTLVSEPNTPWLTYEDRGPIAPDGAGGAYVLWARDDNTGDPGFVQHLTAGGAVANGWLPYGNRVAPSRSQSDSYLTSDGQGGAIVAWSERTATSLAIHAQRFALDGPVAVELSLISAEMRNGRVVLDWFATGTPLSNATVSRRTENSAWSVLGSISADGTGHLRYEDRDVSPDQRYAYRLGYVDDGVDRFTAEAWIDVPALALALNGLRPNPASGPLTVSFALPDASPASLEVLDVSGRRVVQREVGSLGPGNHLVRLDEGASFAPGIYWLRLRQGARTLLARGAVVR